ncbi:lytic transglycosylase domain-containing protein [uncultured Desulfovibrio sp.]|uniref:lytic transglycosylase domain-containing protein n=1 Tax=uncultured Desulfovibrio sp. TaxID=167968 RepID=UPI0004803EFA|nr:lytic transglycosylase domain-containing protein [uncultured Desulfovibrio sp.]
MASCKLRFRAAGACWLAVAALCLLLAGGCATRQGKGPEVSTPSLMLPDDESATPLTQTELAALKSTGQIDRNVPAEAMPDVARQYKYFLRKGRNTMSAFSKCSEQYLAYARKVFRSRGMPDELAYLAIVESGYRSDAKSPAGAAGAWQFMPYTGMKYGLNQDWWMDERLDPYKATEAAADYLQKLYGDFGDWPTAIAAYNAGEGKMIRAKQGTGGRDFFEIKARNHKLDSNAQLREETKQYVPRFLAVAKIMRNLPQLGFESIQPDKAPGMLRFTARPGTDLMAFSSACRLSWEEFRVYNQHHKRPITSTERATFVYVPARYERQATAFLHSPQANAYADWRPVKVTTSADSWDKISRRCNVPVPRLKAANPGNDRLRAEEMVLVPRSVNMSATAVAALDPKESRSSRETRQGKKERLKPGDSRVPVRETTVASGGGHKLQPDETLYAVARKYNVSLKDLQDCNQIDNPSKVRAGCILRIPGGTVPAAPSSGGSSGRVGKAGRKATYTVQAKDSLWNIARKHNVSVDDLKRWNNVDEKSLRAGATLVVNLD